MSNSATHTSHASQGRTLNHSLLVNAEGDVTDRAGIYVPMTRGRQSNRVVAATGTPEPDDTEATNIIIEALQRRWIDTLAISGMADTASDQRAAARAALDHPAKMAKHNRDHHLLDLSDERAIAPSSARLRRSIASNRTDDQGLDL